MAPIDKRLFSGGDEIAAGELQRLEVRNYSGSIDDALKNLGWTGRPAGCVVLKLNADNTSVTGGQFVARGPLAGGEVRLEADKLWARAASGLILSVQVPDASAFTFGDGGLCSDYLDDEIVESCITSSGRAAQVVLEDEYASLGIGKFCLRLVCHISKATVKNGVLLGYSVLVFPGSAEDIGELSELTRSPSWPGLKLAEGELALLPMPATSWKCPLLPLLLTGRPWEDDETHPPFAELRAKIAWIMATSEPADVCRSRKALADKWKKFTDNPDDFVPKKGPLTWPSPQQPTVTGRLI